MGREYHGVFVIGYPGSVGGAGTECWHTIRLWRTAGLPVRCIPTWRADPKWQRRLAAVACPTVQARPTQLHRVAGLAGSVVLAFCNSQFLRFADRFRQLGCRVVWLGCMNWLFAAERRHYHRFGPFDAYVFQSRYQYNVLLPRLSKYGVRPEQCHLIRGAFLGDEFPFRPLEHLPGTPLVLGRLSRAAPDKFSPHTWTIYGSVPHPIRARVMGWSRHVEAHLGPPPPWAQCLPPGSEPAAEFLAGLHAMVQLGGSAVENWPRTGLEAMATGTAVVAERRGGWTEMIEHGRTGLLADDDRELVEHIGRLAIDEPLRLELIHQARRRLESELACPQTIWAAWRRLFAGLGLEAGPRR